MQNHQTLRKATNQTFVLRSYRAIWLPRLRYNTHQRNTCWRSTTIDSRRSRYVNCKALPPRTCHKPWLTHIISPSYITHWAIWAPTTMSSADLGASRHMRTLLQIQHDSRSLHIQELNYKSIAPTWCWQLSFHQISHCNFNN